MHPHARILRRMLAACPLNGQRRLVGEQLEKVDLLLFKDSSIGGENAHHAHDLSRPAEGQVESGCPF